MAGKKDPRYHGAQTEGVDKRAVLAQVTEEDFLGGSSGHSCLVFNL